MSIYKKLFEAKKEIGVISKDSKNPFFKSNYLSLNGLLDAVESVLEKHELLLLQPIEDGKVITMIVDASTEVSTKDRSVEGNSVKSSIELPNITDPQKLGSAITYFRRYTLQSLMGLQAEDDDGNTASKVKVNYDRQNTRLKTCKSLEELQKVYGSFTPAEKQGTLKTKDLLKTKLK